LDSVPALFELTCHDPSLPSSHFPLQQSSFLSYDLCPAHPPTMPLEVLEIPRKDLYTVHLICIQNSE